MKPHVALAMLLCLSAVGLTAEGVQAHSGGLDAYGCHHDRKHGGYHCHRGPLAGQTFESQPEMLAAVAAHSLKPNDHPDWAQPPSPAKKSPQMYTILRASL